MLIESDRRKRILGVPLPHLFLGVTAMALGLALCAAIIHHSGQGVVHWLGALRELDPRWAMVVLAGMAVNLVLAAKKWQRVEACLASFPPSSNYAVSITAIGWGVGQFLPVPVAAAAVRGLGNRLCSRSGRHGMLASVWEQLFDLAAAVLLTVPALIALMHGSLAVVVAVTTLAIVFGELAAVRIPGLLIRVARMNLALGAPSLCRFLWRLSLLRTIILMAVTVVVARAMAAEIRPELIAASVPPVILAGVLSCVPAGIGVNELSFVSLLGLAGVGSPAATAFALVNRGLQLIIALVLALAGAVAIAVNWPKHVRQSATLMDAE